MSVSYIVLSLGYSESEKFDPRDLQRVKNDLEFVAKFIRQQRGNRDNAINQMVRDYYKDPPHPYFWCL